jgi:hypothetical protein
MKWTTAVIACLMSAALSSKALSQDLACSPVTASGAGFVQECGSQLYAFDLTLLGSKLGLSGIKREAKRDFHGRFGFSCPIEPMCAGEPLVGGFFVEPADWLKSAKDEQAIFGFLRSMPWPGGNRPPTPVAACPVFDVSIGGLNGRAVCLSEEKSSTVLVVAADDHIGFLLHFSRDDEPVAVLKGKVLEMLPRFEIHRATGDIALKRWMR